MEGVVAEKDDDPLSGRADLNRRPPAPHAGALNLAALRPDVEADYNPAPINRQCCPPDGPIPITLPEVLEWASPQDLFY